MAGQRVIFSYPGLTVPPALLALITAGEAAGVIFFGDNISGDAQIASVIGQLGKAQKAARSGGCLARRTCRKSRSASPATRPRQRPRPGPEPGRTSPAWA
jgi:hypothetical protein